jgi:RNA polymerase sigma-70 factor (ECF subfamily)
MSTAALIETTYREEHGRLIAALISQFGDFTLAEDALQDALVIALERWECDGVPRNPGAWLMTVAKRRAIDRLRRGATQGRTTDLLDIPAIEEDEPDMDIPDERLKLMFTCCHPSLALEAQIALTLHTLGGLSTPEVARAFRVTETTMAQPTGTGTSQNPQCRHSVPCTACRTAAGAVRCTAGGHLPDLQRGLLRHQRRFAYPPRFVC